MDVIKSFRGEYEFLSNFYQTPILYEGIEYPTVEHAFQAAKTFDKEKRLHICNSPTPGGAKQKGRRVLLREDWECVKVGIMYELLQIKFSDEVLKEKLLATGESELIEGNIWNDRFWGVCQGTGKNTLGKLLMQIRSELQQKRL